MSKYFVLAEPGIGPGGQITFRKAHREYNWYSVYLDDVKIGQVMEAAGRRKRWTGLSNAEESIWFAVRSMDGFATRLDAATFVIKHHGYWMSDEREMIKTLHHGQKFITKFKMRKTLEIMKGHRGI